MRLPSPRILGVIVAVLLVAGLSVYRVANWEFGFGDTSFLTQLADNIASRGKAVSQLSASFDEMFSKVFTTPADELCSGPLKIQSVVEFNYFKWHAYAILYLIAPLTWILGAKVTLSILTALSFAVMPIGAYYFLRKRNVGHLTCIVVSLLIVSHPAWSMSIQGQLYADRLFLGLGFLIFLLLESPEKNRTSILVLLVVGSTVSERFGLVLGSCTIMYLVLCRRAIRANLAIYATSALLAAFSLYLLKYVIVHPSNASFASSMTVNAFLINYKSYPSFQPNFWCFVLLTGGFMLAGLKSWRLLAIALFAALPNFMGNIGGAEKTGFLTHYHSTYFPIMAAAVVTAAATDRGALTVLLRTLHLGLFLMIGTAAPSLSPRNLLTSGPVTLWKDCSSLISGYKVVAGKWNREINAAIPPGSNVVTLEALMPTLYPHAANLQMYPLGIDDAHFVILPWTQPVPGGPYAYPASYSFLGTAERTKQDRLFRERLNRLGFDLDHPKIIGAWAILTKPQ